jgi:hypothetical protein
LGGVLREGRFVLGQIGHLGPALRSGSAEGCSGAKIQSNRAEQDERSPSTAGNISQPSPAVERVVCLADP